MMKSMLAGSAKVDITPPLTIPYLGYEPRHAFFQGVHDPLYARAVALDDGVTQAILITADALGFSNALLGPGRNFTTEVRQRVAAHTGVPPAHVLLTASHAHSTPETCHLRRLLDTPSAAPWLEVLMDQLASVATLAFAQRQPSRLKAGCGQVLGLARNRRVLGPDGLVVAGPELTPDLTNTTPGPLDSSVGVLLIEAFNGTATTVLANFACHPVTVQVQPLVSADFPGVAMAVVERILPHCGNSLFLQGACGDINPIRNTTDFADVERYGLMLGGEIVKVAAQLSAGDFPILDPVLAVGSQTISLAVRELPSHAAAQQAYQIATAELAAASPTERSQRQRVQRLAEEALLLVECGAEPIPAEVQVLRIGEWTLVALPGEPFTELGLAIKDRSVAAQTWVCGYANDWIGYLTPPSAWQQGGYEVGLGPWTRVGPQGGNQLVDCALALIASTVAA